VRPSRKQPKGTAHIRVAKRASVVMNPRAYQRRIVWHFQAPRSRVSEWCVAVEYKPMVWRACSKGNRSGRPRNLNEKQREQLGDISSGPVALWIGLRDMDLNPLMMLGDRREFGIIYPGHCVQADARLGFSGNVSRACTCQSGPRPLAALYLSKP